MAAIHPLTPVHGLLAPGSFMPEVERTELIEPVTRWVLNQALHQQQIWHAEGIDLTMAVNISANSLRPGSNLPEIVAELTETWSTPPGCLMLELTEGALIEAHAPEILDRLHQTGQTLSIDDFGTGYSSLAYLQRLPVDELKIDRSFIIDLPADGNAEVIVRSIIDLAHNLDLTIVAEGVEDQAAMDLLIAYGCDSVQGYLLGRPCAIEDFNRSLAESRFASADRHDQLPAVTISMRLPSMRPGSVERVVDLVEDLVGGCGVVEIARPHALNGMDGSD